MDDEYAFGARLADQLDDTLEHTGLLVVLRELAVPRAVGRDEIGLEVDQQDGGLFRLNAFCRRRHRLRLRRCEQAQQRGQRRRDLDEMSPGNPPHIVKSSRTARPRQRSGTCGINATTTRAIAASARSYRGRTDAGT